MQDEMIDRLVAEVRRSPVLARLRKMAGDLAEVSLCILLRRDGEVITKTVQLGGIQSVASLRMAEYAAGGLLPQDDDQDQDADDGGDEDEGNEDKDKEDPPRHRRRRW